MSIKNANPKQSEKTCLVSVSLVGRANNLEQYYAGDNWDWLDEYQFLS